MAQFEEVLHAVRLALTWASPPEIQALLAGLVEDKIISEAYSRSLGLGRFPGCVSQEPGDGGAALQIHCLASVNLWNSAEDPCRLESALGASNRSDPRPALGMDKHYPQHSLWSNDEMRELLKSAETMQKQARDNERMEEGNLDCEREWLEQVEEAARKLAVPLWQHWDRGHRMLQSVVPCLISDLAACETTATGGPDFNMEEETELACRTLDFYANTFDCSGGENQMDPNLMLDAGQHTKSTKDLCMSTFHGLQTIDSTADCWLDFTGHAKVISPVQACAASGSVDVYGRAAETADGLLTLKGDAQHGFPGFAGDTAYPFDLSSDADPGGSLSDVDNVFRGLSCTKQWNNNSVSDFQEERKREERLDSSLSWGGDMQEMDQGQFVSPYAEDPQGSKMQEVDQELCLFPDFGDLSDLHDLSEYLTADSLDTIDAEMSMVFSSFNCAGDVPMPTELPGPDSQQQRHEETPTVRRSRRRKCPRVHLSQSCTEDSVPPKPKRQREAGQPKPKEVQARSSPTQGVDAGSGSSPAEMGGLSPAPRIFSIHLAPGSQFLIRLPLPNAAASPTYIIVPAASPPSNQIPPLSPVDGAVVPVQTSSAPAGSLSDTASKVTSPTCTSPISPISEISTCKDSPPPQSPTVRDIPQVVKDFIQEAKVHVSQTCQDVEDGLGLTSHYVEVPLSQREVSPSGKSTMKFLEKELAILGDTDRQKSLLSPRQIFEASDGGKPKRYVLLLGDAGMGKTTLIKKLCLDWSRDRLPQFDFVFLLDGKALAWTQPTFSLQTLLLNLSPSAPCWADPDAVYAQILAAPRRVLVIFDGFDELRDYETLLQTMEKDVTTSLQRDGKARTHTVRQLYSAILQRVLIPGCTLLLSTRAKGTANQILRRADRFVEPCGFTPKDIEAYLSQHFSDPALRASALKCLKANSYLQLLCWNPGLCRLVCLVLERAESLEVLPRTLTGLCHEVFRLVMEKDRKTAPSQAEPETQASAGKPLLHISSRCEQQKSRKSGGTKSRATGRTLRSERLKTQEKEEDDVDGEEDNAEERDLLSQLSSLAWDGVKANCSIVPNRKTISTKVKAFGHRTGLFVSYSLRKTQAVSSGGGRGSEDNDLTGKMSGNRGRTESNDACGDHLLSWANPFLQSYLAGVHLSRTASERTLLQALPFQLGSKGRRRPQREELELTQRFAVGLLFHSSKDLHKLRWCTKTDFRDMLVGKRALVTKFLKGLKLSDLSPPQVLEACHYVCEASSKHGDGGKDSGHLVAHLAASLPEVLTFRGVPLNPADVFAVQTVLASGGRDGRSFCLDLEDSGIPISGLRALVGLETTKTYRACIADVITLWEELEESGAEEALWRGAVSKFKIHPLKVTQLHHVEHLAKLVNIHVRRRLSDSSSQMDCMLAEGVPAVKELRKLEFELGPEDGPLALPKLWELLPGLHNLQHLDLENSKIGDKGAEKLADALVSHCALEVLNLSQNCIGDQGVKKLSAALRDLPKLHCLSLYSNVISDEGAESLAAVLPDMASLTDLDVKYNKLTDVGAQSLGLSLRGCKKMRSLRLWNQCIPYGVFERLQQQDGRILWH